MLPLEPLKLDMQGQILIEASAGTGKTYTIGLLFVRLLLEQKLSVDQILVVTFTRAATEELRGRLRLRVREALDILSDSDQKPDDKLLQDLMAGVNDPEEAAILLGDALTRMDEAAIFTIHGFCQRMLQEHAFESGAPFEMEFIETEQLLRRRIMEDFWRNRFYGVAEAEAAWAASLWKTPGDLLSVLSGQLGRPGVQCLPDVPTNELVRQEKTVLPLFTQVRTMWQREEKIITEILTSNGWLSRDNTKAYGLIRLAAALEDLSRFLTSSELPWLAPSLLELFTSSKIASSLKKKGKDDPPDHPFFKLFNQFFSSFQKLADSRRFAVLLAARKYLLTELVKRKQEQAQLYFDDLLSQLDAALQGDDGNALALSISKRFPVIMVDEFQDTDPLQYRIFSAIHAQQPDTGLFLIGDPKQAIYAFRGADIFTYLQARRNTQPEKRLTMTTNYRSTTPMVQAVNRIFDRENSFLLNSDELTFSPVQAAEFADKTPLLLEGKQLPPLTCLLLPEKTNGKPLAKKDAGAQAAPGCAQEIAGLLAAGLAKKAMIGDKPLSAGDIAVLVRTHVEAAQIRTELSRFSIASVYYSQDTVFASAEADLLATVLTALVDLSDTSLIRTALATDMFGYRADQLDLLRRDEQQWEEIMAVFTGYTQLWQRQGFTPMFQQLLADQKVVARLQVVANGERMLTNLLHLAELLQEASQQQTGTEGLLRWFNDQMQAPEEQTDSRQLRLESDENLVKIVTIHKAKGLEYPVVFLPFLWAARACNSKEPLAFHPPDNPEQLAVDLGTGDPAHFQMAEQERLAGDLRLLYVAVTRARYSCFFCWGRVNKMETSALSYLLHGEEPPARETFLPQLEQLDTPKAPLVLKPCTESISRIDLDISDHSTPLAVTAFTGTIDASWQITSYSRLTASHEQQPERPDYDQRIDDAPQVPGHDVFGFPKGAAAGTCLHAILERISFTDPSNHEQIIADQLNRAGFDESWLPVAVSWMQDILQTELATGLSLSGLHDQDRVNEMSFYFPLQSLDLDQFNRILKKFSYSPLPDRHGSLQGLMVGFIDLVFRFNGRYYVADYKSNHLGSHPDNYGPENLQTAMLDHRYDLQYLIYTLALHRFLGRRIRDYAYEKHFGSVLYLFLRGINPGHDPNTGVYTARPPLALIEQLDQCCAGLEVQ